MTSKQKKISVEVVYATTERQDIVSLTVTTPITAAEAIGQSRIAEYFQEINLDRNRIGIFGKQISPDTLLRDRDRVEIYRTLVADPKDVRRRRAEARQSSMKRRGN